jgi:uncharacterized OsmC-like protein
MSPNPAVPASSGEPSDLDGQQSARQSITMSVTARVLEGARSEGLIEQVEPPGSTFTLVSDEASMMGGLGSAPTPLHYHAASHAFSMISHVNWFAAARKLKFDAVTVQVTTRFYTAGSPETGSVEAGTLEFDTHIEVESSDPAESVALALKGAELSCFTDRALVTPVLVNRTYALNGHTLAVPAEG